MKSPSRPTTGDAARAILPRRTIDRRFLPRGLACLPLLMLCLFPAASTAQADEADMSAAQQATVEELVRLQRIQQLFQLVDMAEQAAARRKQAAGRNYAEPDDREDVLRDIAAPPRFPHTAAGAFAEEARPSVAETLMSLLQDMRIFGPGLFIALVLALYFGAIRPARARRRDDADSRADSRRAQYAAWKRQRLARRDKLE